MKNEKIPGDHHVLRYVAYNRCRKDEHGNILGCLPQAFEHRPATATRKAEEYLSVTWVEHFGGNEAEHTALAVQAFRKTYNAGAMSAFVKGNVEETHAACALYNSRIRILHAPSKLNPGHSAMRQVPRDNLDLLSLLADDVFREITLNSAIP